ncbi:hypothetical protein GCM10023187_36640 [Nibrella viscosa]|uniref:Major Facilitator Superfamily protein n=1 Tax=Nibrella viscosa TaxID=1084524 RepID=A0ABP8KPM4_9BACT
MLYAAILGLVGFVTSLGAHIIAVNLPVYANQAGIGLTLIGLLIAVFAFAEIAAKPVFNWIGDRNSMKMTLMLGPLAGYWADCMPVTVTIRLGLLLSASTLLAIPFVAGLSLLLVALPAHSWEPLWVLRVLSKS